ncbi:hypothetical protein SAMN05421839_10149 [Halolactibacillus halophilus]|uniref:Uncharacterized protein n=1 Tax=Halolactibacillus halophilus TaxID=306540 RepID=A0A1I5KUR4_9BACI|nr:hypothetical protein [Halolactibacillus halophilus]GEM00509.1 hypothetical protein HHA03_00410 [Halolactibacillus halophilus]SFO88622.1 hypothetical protein SAMN05421839_10149 [Halolactibacillus halophilus]
MEDIIVPLISFLIIVGSSVLKSKSDEGKQAEKKTPKQMKTKPQPVMTERTEPSPQVETYSEYEYSPYAEAEREEKLSTNQTMESQLHDLRDKLAVDSKKESDRKVRVSRQQMNKTTKDMPAPEPKKQVKRSLALKNQLSKGGLKRSVIMAEVLSPPRAKKPYQTRKYN